MMKYDHSPVYLNPALYTDIILQRPERARPVCLPLWTSIQHNIVAEELIGLISFTMFVA